MLDTLYFLSMLGGIAWLAWWATAGAASSRPAPFDMREPAKAEPPVATGPAAVAQGWRGRRG